MFLAFMGVPLHLTAGGIRREWRTGSPSSESISNPTGCSCREMRVRG
ncbi:MAG: hypothetical protein KatS3mg107_1121 [Gemmataceae bacterium]|nr:MAG: hypothetical protein KatS3mg107_1121 [Gemmataceae bacterium]